MLAVKLTPRRRSSGCDELRQGHVQNRDKILLAFWPSGARWLDQLFLRLIDVFGLETGLWCPQKVQASQPHGVSFTSRGFVSIAHSVAKESPSLR